MIVVLLAWFLLGEKLTIREIIFLLCAFAAAVMMILGSKVNSTHTDYNSWAYAVLFLNPIVISTG